MQIQRLVLHLNRVMLLIFPMAVSLLVAPPTLHAGGAAPIAAASHRVLQSAHTASFIFSDASIPATRAVDSTSIQTIVAVADNDAMSLSQAFDVFISVTAPFALAVVVFGGFFRLFKLFASGF